MAAVYATLGAVVCLPCVLNKPLLLVLLLLLLVLLLLLLCCAFVVFQPTAIKVPVQAHFGDLDTMKGFSDAEVRTDINGLHSSL